MKQNPFLTFPLLTDAKIEAIVKPPGLGFTFEEIEQVGRRSGFFPAAWSQISLFCQAVDQHRPQVLFVCHGESTTGVVQPLEGLGALCHRHDSLLLVDAVASLGGAPCAADHLQTDCVYSASQKVLGCPPGLAPITFSERAMYGGLPPFAPRSAIGFLQEQNSQPENEAEVVLPGRQAHRQLLARV